MDLKTIFQFATDLAVLGAVTFLGYKGILPTEMVSGVLCLYAGAIGMRRMTNGGGGNTPPPNAGVTTALLSALVMGNGKRS